MLTRLTLLGLCCLCACSSTTQNAPKAQPAQAASAQTPLTQEEGESRLTALLDELRALEMKTQPTWATYEGIREYDDQVSDESQAASLRYITQVEAIAARAAAIPASSLTPMSQDTQRMLAMHAVELRQGLVCKFDLWNIHGLHGPQVNYPMLPVFHLIRSQKDVDTLAARYGKLGVQVDQIIANLRQGLSEGLSAPKVNVQRALTQTEALLAHPVDATHPMLKLKLASADDSFDTTALSDQLRTVVIPALRRYRDLFKADILPVARDHVGVENLAFGQACYGAKIKGYIGGGYTPEQLHQLGLEQLAISGQGMMDVVTELGYQTISPANAMEIFLKDVAQKATSEEQLLTLSTQSCSACQAGDSRILWDPAKDAGRRAPHGASPSARCPGRLLLLGT